MMEPPSASWSVIHYALQANPRSLLRKNGATEEECRYLVRRGDRHSGWSGERVELNAMTSDEFISWLEQKLTEAGVTKVVPNEKQLAATYRRTVRIARVSRAIRKIMRDQDVEDITVPARLGEQIRDAIAGTTQSWDEALLDLVDQARHDHA